MVGIADLRRVWPDRVFIDEAEVMRLEDVQVYVLPACGRCIMGRLYGVLTIGLVQGEDKREGSTKEAEDEEGEYEEEEVDLCVCLW